MKHDERCEFIPFRRVSEDMGEPAPADDDWYDQAGLMRCVDSCPSLEASRALGRELALKYGW